MIDVASLGAAAVARVGQALRQSSAPAVAQQSSQLEAVATSRSTTPAPADLVAEAEQAQTPPPGEAESRAQAATVEAVGGATAPAPDPAAARQTLGSAVEAGLPETLEEVDEFGDASAMTAQVQSLVQSQTAGVAQTYGAIETTPPPAAPATPTVPVPAPPPPPAVDRPDLGADAVGTFPAEAADLSDMTAASDDALAQSGLSEEHLALVTDGPLAEARAEREGVREQVEAAPGAIDETRAAEQAQVHGELQTEEQAAEAEMQAERDAELQGARTEQDAATVEMERKRAEVAAHIQGIYDRANTAVTEKLDALETASIATFEAGRQEATDAFEANTKRRMDAWKDRRYSGLLGWGRWATDLFYDITEFPAVKAIIDEEKATFVAAIDALIASITADIDAAIAECRQLIADAKVEIDEYVAGLEPGLQDVGQQKADEMATRFEALDRRIEERREAAQATLAEAREEAIARVEEMIEDMRTGIAAALGRLVELLANAAEAFIRWALTTAGKDPEAFFGALRRAGDVIGGIVSDPLSFLGHLIDAVGLGIRKFGDNIQQHLIGGFIEWLTGAMSSVPIELPQTWDLRGIIHLVLQILGLTWDRIRAKLVRRVGERPVAIAEASVDIIRRLITDGPIALWDMLVEKAEEIKGQAMEAMQGWAILQLVKAGILKLVSMLNPAGAIVQGIITIFNVIMFFVENMQRILAFAQSVVDSVANIAAGRIGAAAGFIEQAMARTIPVILGFLGRLIPVTGIGRAVSNAIKRVRRPIDRVVDRAIDGMVRLIRRVVGGARRGARRAGRAARDAAGRVLQWWRKERRFRDRTGASHRAFLRRRGRQVELTVASTPRELRRALYEMERRPPPGTTRAQIRAALDAAARVQTVLDRMERDGFDRARSRAEQQRVEANDRELDRRMGQLVPLLRPLPLSGQFDLPRPIYQFRLQSGKARLATAEKLSPNRPMGTPTGESQPKGWAHLQEGLTTSAPNWKQLHLINRRFGGRGRRDNLVPGTARNNSSDHPPFDAAASRLIGQNPRSQTAAEQNVIWIRAEVSYRSAGEALPHYSRVLPRADPRPPDARNYARSIRFTMGRYDLRGTDWVKSRSVLRALSMSIPLPDWSPVLAATPSLQSANVATVVRAARSAGFTAGVEDAFRTTTLGHIRAAGPFSNVPDMNRKMHLAATQPRIHEATRRDLRRARVMLFMMYNRGTIAFP